MPDRDTLPKGMTPELADRLAEMITAYAKNPGKPARDFAIDVYEEIAVSLFSRGRPAP